MTKDQKAAFVREYQENVTRLFDPQTQILTERFQHDNYGLNSSENINNSEESKVHQYHTPETQKILKALNEVPLVKQSDTMNYMQQSKYGQTGVTQGFRINSDISMTAQTAQPSLIAHFDTPNKQSFSLTEDNLKDFKISKMQPVPTIRP